MIIPNYCPRCRNRIAKELWSNSPQVWSTVGPWPCTFRNRQGRCHNCTSGINACTSDLDPDNATIWLKHHQILSEGDTYKLVRQRRHPQPLDGRKQTICYWWNHPMPGTEWDQRVVKQLESDKRYLDRKQVSVLIYGPGADTSWALSNIKLFDHVWQLEPSVVDGAAGPYTSIKAELSIVNTLASMKLQEVLHCWPTAFINKAHYRRIGTDEEMLTAWAQYQRQQLTLEVNP